MRKIGAVICVLGLLAWATPAWGWNYAWNAAGPGADWSVGANWLSSTGPINPISTTGHIANGGICEVGLANAGCTNVSVRSNSTLNIKSGMTLANEYAYVNSGGLVTVTDGTFDVYISYRYQGQLFMDNGAVTVAAAGTLDVENDLRMENGSSIVSAGTFTTTHGAIYRPFGVEVLSGSSIEISGGTYVSKWDMDVDGSGSSIIQSGGSVSLAPDATYREQTFTDGGLLKISGGAFQSGAGYGNGLYFYDSTLEVVGKGPTSIAVGHRAAVYGGSTLKCHVDADSGGITPIIVGDGVGDDARFYLGSSATSQAIVDMEIIGNAPADEAEFLLVDCESLYTGTDYYVLAAGDEAHWEIITETVTDTVTAKYWTAGPPAAVPEPATLALLGLGGLGVLLRRRRN